MGVKTLGRRQWKQVSGSHRQGRVENTFFRDTSIIGDGLRARSPAGQGSPTELTARIRAALRRRSNPVPFVLGELAIDYDRRRVSVAGRPVTLTPTEYELLRVLAQGAGRVLTHEDLLRQVWAGRGHGKANPKIVRAYVKRLRHQLGDDAARPAWIVNERGVGYRMARPGEPGEP